MSGLSAADATAAATTGWRAVWGRAPTSNELAFALAIARLETGWGRSGQFAAMADQGLYEWGALEHARNADGTCPAGLSPGVDTGKPVCFFVYPSDAQAAAAFIRTLTKTHWPGVIAAMATGDPTAVAQAMRGPPPYYAGVNGTEEDKINAYASLIAANLRAIGTPVGTPSSGGLGWLFAIAAVGGAAWYVHRRGVPRPVQQIWTRAKSIPLF